MFAKCFHPGDQRKVLISCKGFCRIKKDRTGDRIFQDFLYYRQIKAQGFTAGCRRGDHDIFSIYSMGKNFCLVGIERFYILPDQKLPDIRMEVFKKLCVFWKSGWDYLFVNDAVFHCCSFAVNLLGTVSF